MKCVQAERLMDAALDELSGSKGIGTARRADLDLHLSSCARCRAQWEVLRVAEVALRAPRPVAAPDWLLADFRSRLAQESTSQVRAEKPRSGSWAWLWPFGTLTAAGAAAAAVVVFGMVPPPQGPTQSGATPLGTRLVPPPAPAAVSSTSETVRPRVLAATPAPRDGSVKAIPAQPAGKTGSAVATDFLGSTPDLTVKFNAPRPKQRNFAGHQGAQDDAVRVQPSTLAKNSVSVLALAQDHAAFGRSQDADKHSFYSKRANQSNTAHGSQGVVRTVAEEEKREFAEQTDRLTLQFNLAIGNASGDYYAQVPAEPISAELNVSPAVLNALQRPVEITGSATQVGEIVEQLSVAADVVLRIDPKFAAKNITVTDSNAPLWLVLEDVARQGSLEIYPSENGLVLQRISRAGGVAGKLDGKVGETLATLPKPRGVAAAPAQAPDRSPMPTAKPAVEPAAPAAPAGPAAPGKAESEGMRRAFRFTEQKPDRRVWPAAWGNLPERGFEVPSYKELPALVLAPDSKAPQEVPRVRLRLEDPVKKGAPSKASKSPK
jgi:hypothetical protein